MKKRCHELAADVDCLAADALPPAQAQVIEAHLAECAECRVRYEQSRILCADLSAAAKVVAPSDVAAWRLRNRVRLALLEAPAKPHRWRLLAPALGTVGILVFLALPDGREQRQPSSTPGPVAVVIVPTEDHAPPTRLAYQRALVQSDAALERLQAHEVSYRHTPDGEPPQTLFPPF